MQHHVVGLEVSLLQTAVCDQERQDQTRRDGCIRAQGYRKWLIACSASKSGEGGLGVRPTAKGKRKWWMCFAKGVYCPTRAQLTGDMPRT